MTKIEWTTSTWNPTTGCSPVSKGCDNCYAAAMSKRLQAMGLAKYRDGFKVRCHPYELGKPLHWKKPRMIFVNSMSDLFHHEVPDEFIVNVCDVIRRRPQHIFQILTKRPKRMKQFGWPDNVWIGVSAENQKEADHRIPHLLETTAAVRFVSAEPLLAPLDLQPFFEWTNIDGERVNRGPHWVIVGCETGPKRRPCDIEWVRDIVEQCRAAGVPVFVKKLDIDGKVTGDMDKWPEDLRVREYPERGAQ